jgi:hypothetical protein
MISGMQAVYGKTSYWYLNFNTTHDVYDTGWKLSTISFIKYLGPTLYGKLRTSHVTHAPKRALLVGTSQVDVF